MTIEASRRWGTAAEVPNARRSDTRASAAVMAEPFWSHAYAALAISRAPEFARRLFVELYRALRARRLASTR